MILLLIYLLMGVIYTIIDYRTGWELELTATERVVMMAMLTFVWPYDLWLLVRES